VCDQKKKKKRKKKNCDVLVFSDSRSPSVAQFLLTASAVGNDPSKKLLAGVGSLSCGIKKADRCRSAKGSSPSHGVFWGVGGGNSREEREVA